VVQVSKLLRKGKALILSYDQGLEHGPHEFSGRSVDPEYIFDLALEGGFSAIACHVGIAEKYYKGAFRDVPLIVKLNGSTTLPHINPLSAQVCSVERALKAGASAVGFTIYDGSPNEPAMFEQFGKICEQAHDYGLPVICWMYPRGPGIQSHSNEILTYSARIAAELGADIVKIKHNGDQENLKWLVRAAGRTGVVLAGGRHRDAVAYLNEVKDAVAAGCLGIAVGRNVWQSKKPFNMAKALREIVYDGKSVAAASELLT